MPTSYGDRLVTTQHKRDILKISLSHSDVFKPVRSTILLKQKLFAVSEEPGLASFTFRRVRTIKVWYVLVADISEPNDLCVGHSSLRSRKTNSQTYQ